MTTKPAALQSILGESWTQSERSKPNTVKNKFHERNEWAQDTRKELMSSTVNQLTLRMREEKSTTNPTNQKKGNRTQKILGITVLFSMISLSVNYLNSLIKRTTIGGWVWKIRSGIYYTVAYPDKSTSFYPPWTIPNSQKKLRFLLSCPGPVR